MEEDLRDKERGKPQSHEEKKEGVHRTISELEEKLGQSIGEESKKMIHKNELEGTEEVGNVPQSEATEDYRLKQEAKELGDKQREKENSASALKEKLKSGEFTNSVKKLAITLREREAHGFNPLINPNVISYLIFAANELESSVINPKASLEDVNRSIKKIGGAIKAIGDVPRQMRINDHPDSLRKVGFALQNIDQASLNLASRIGGLEDNNMGETIHYLRSLQNLTIDK